MVVRTVCPPSVREAWAERLGVSADHVDGELEARFAALVHAITNDDPPPVGSPESAELYGDLYTIRAFVNETTRALWRDEVRPR
jgi:hypothetical protein